MPDPDEDERLGELTDEILSQYGSDPEKIKEADSWWSGELDSGDYETIESALADFGAGDSSSSELIARVEDIAKYCAEKRAHWLEHMAENEAIARIIVEDRVNAEMRDSYTKGDGNE